MAFLGRQKEEKKMKKYYVSNAIGAHPEDACAWYKTAEEAEKARDSWKAEIMAGVYDSELDIEPDERQEMADNVEAYAVEYTSGGAVKSNTRII